MNVAHLHKPVREINGLSLYVDGEIAIIVMNRGENRLNSDFFHAFMTLLDDVEKLPTCKALITTGVGKFFCNGLDLAWLTETNDAETTEEFFRLFKELIRRVLLFPLPTVAAINGHCFAGGAVLAFAHDLRTMRTGYGWLCLNEVWIKLKFFEYLLVFLRDKLGSGQNLSAAVVLGHRFTAEEAWKNGMVHTICTESLLTKESARLLKSYYGKTGYPRESLADMKKAVYKNTVDAMNADRESVLSKM